jgi:hypothetical protein
MPIAELWRMQAEEMPAFCHRRRQHRTCQQPPVPSCDRYRSTTPAAAPRSPSGVALGLTAGCSHQSGSLIAPAP